MNVFCSISTDCFDKVPRFESPADEIRNDEQSSVRGADNERTPGTFGLSVRSDETRKRGVVARTRYAEEKTSETAGNCQQTYTFPRHIGPAYEIQWFARKTTVSAYDRQRQSYPQQTEQNEQGILTLSNKIGWRNDFFIDD